MRKYVFSLGLCSLISAVLVVCSLRSLPARGVKALIPYIFLSVGVLGLLFAVRDLAKLFSGKVLFKEALSLSLNGGELRFSEPTSRFELWIFCQVPFPRYNGNIFITSG